MKLPDGIVKFDPSNPDHVLWAERDAARNGRAGVGIMSVALRPKAKPARPAYRTDPSDEAAASDWSAVDAEVAAAGLTDFVEGQIPIDAVHGDLD